MNKVDLTRRKFLGRTGTAALALPLAAAIPAAIEVTSPKSVEAAMEVDERQPIPNRATPARTIGSGTATADMPTDGSDCSQAIKDAITSLGSGGGVVTIPWRDTDKDTSGNDKAAGPFCEYLLDIMAHTYINQRGQNVYYGVELANNIRIQAAPGVVIKAMPNHGLNPVNAPRAFMFLCRDVNNVEICNMRLIGERYTHDYSSGGTHEYGHGIQIVGSQHVTVRACIISDCTGDGICVGRYNGVDPSDIFICDVVCTGNRRQGLSLTGGDNLQVYDSEFSHTYGTAPQNGIDVEPEGGSNLSGVTIENCLVRGNSGHGIELNANGTSTLVENFTVKYCLVAGNSGHGVSVHGPGAITTGGIYGNAIYQNGKQGLMLWDSPTGYTVGAVDPDHNFSNNFCNNDIGTYSYPHNNTPQNLSNYQSGSDMNFSSAAQSNTTVNYNTYLS